MFQHFATPCDSFAQLYCSSSYQCYTPLFAIMSSFGLSTISCNFLLARVILTKFTQTTANMQTEAMVGSDKQHLQTTYGPCITGCIPKPLA
jgi:hypothetical protein